MFVFLKARSLSLTHLVQAYCCDLDALREQVETTAAQVQTNELQKLQRPRLTLDVLLLRKRNFQVLVHQAANSLGPPTQVRWRRFQKRFKEVVSQLRRAKKVRIRIELNWVG